MLYLVSYDLKGGASSDYQALYDEFTTFDGCMKSLESSWLVKTNLGCKEVRDKLYAKMGADDYIVVVPYANPRSAILPARIVNWIRENIDS